VAIHVPTVVVDLFERAAKTFAWSFASAVPLTSWAQGWHAVPWALASCIATGATLLSLVGNTASIPFAGNGLASLVPTIVKLFKSTPAALAAGSTTPAG
jgi:hypothetical protein